MSAVPSRSLFDPTPRRHRYVDSSRTDIRRTFRKARLLAFLRRNKETKA